jgi:phosphatidylglycerophosphatase A
MSPKLLRSLTTLGRLGHANTAPGTVGSVASALVLYWPFAILPGTLDLVFAVLICGGCALFLKLANPQEDESCIVIDETAGVTLALLFCHGSFMQGFLALFLFRVFDILKPGPIRSLERWQPPWLGIYADDMGAGLAAGITAVVLLQGAKFVGF